MAQKCVHMTAQNNFQLFHCIYLKKALNYFTFNMNNFFYGISFIICGQYLMIL
jgi:hypothetical protein